MDPLQASLKLLNVRTVLQETLAALSPEESHRHEEHLSRLSAALDEYAMHISPIPLTDGFLRKKSPKGSNHLALLPETAIKNIVRHVSARPRSPHWRKFLHPADAETLFCLPGPLGAKFAALFPEVDIGSDEPPRPPVKYASPPSKYFPPPKPKYPLEKAWAMQLRCRGWTSGARRVLDAAGASVTHVAYRGDGQKDSAPHLLSWIAPFRAHCAGVRHLSVSEMDFSMFEQLFSARPGALESLSLDSASSSAAHLECVARHCAGLRDLTLSALRAAPVALWRAVGPTLEGLSLRILRPPPPPPVHHHHHGAPGAPGAPPDASELVRAVQEHCRALRRIRLLQHPTALHSDVSAWFRSYGPQLEFARANFAAMPPDTCRHIADGCPEAVFEIMALTRPAAVADLRFRVRDIAVEEEATLSSVEAERIGANCGELTRLALHGMKWQLPVILASLLHVPKPQLKEVSLVLLQDSTVQAFTQLAQLATSIKNFKIVFSEAVWDWKLEGVKEMLTANAGMESIYLDFGAKARTVTLATLLRFVRICIDALPELQELIIVGGAAGYAKGLFVEVTSLTQIADVCIPLRKRNTHVHILGVDYM